jgi:hypothetical protein
MSVDPLQTKYPWFTPYQYASNRPIDGVDRDGLEWCPPLKVDRQTGKLVPDGDAAIAIHTDSRNMLAVAVTLDIVLTKGWATRTLLASQVAGALYHNKASTPEGRRVQNENSKEVLTEAAIVYGTGEVFGIGLKMMQGVRVPYTTKMGPEIKVKVDASAGSEFLDDGIRMNEQPFQRSANSIVNDKVNAAKATDFIRTETIGGNNAARTVGANIKIVNSGGSLAPIEVAEINNKLYVINGHHRLEAALRTNTELRYKILSKTELQERGYKSESEIVHAAAETTKVKLDNKIVKKVAGQE